MSRKVPGSISVVTVDMRQNGEDLKMLPSPLSGITRRYSTVAKETLKNSLIDFVNTLGDMVGALPECSGGYTIDNLTFALSVNGSGKISLVGELSAGVTTSITVTLKKQGVK